MLGGVLGTRLYKNGLWCNDSTNDFGSFSLGLNPSSPASSFSTLRDNTTPVMLSYMERCEKRCMSSKQESQSQLTDEQRELVTKNHNLIYAFAHKRNISIEDYYDILAIGLCKSAKVFDQNKGSFSSVAFKCMENELYEQWSTTHKKSAIPNHLVLSYDAPQISWDSDNQDSLLENICDNDAHDSMMYAIISSELMDKLTVKEKMIVSLLKSGLTHSEIADRFNCRRQNVTYYVKQIRKKVDDCLLNN